MNHDPNENLKSKTSGHVLKYLIILGVFLFLASAVSAYWNTRETGKKYEQLATVIGRSIFQELVVVRRWNAGHGGIYVPVTEGFQPNPYLEDPRRDVTTMDGMRLTKINPEYMTRLLSKLLEKENGIKIHITSLKLLSPANQADSWEQKALERFERGSKEEIGLVASRDSATFRYMAPLKTEDNCLTCHANQGHKVGDIRGGLSVSFSYIPFQEAINATNKQIYTVHIFFFLIGVAIVCLLGKRLITKIEELQEALRQIKRLEGFLPICAHCKKVRKEGADPKDEESWVPIEIFIKDRTDADFSHGICPVCVRQHFQIEYDKLR